MNEDTEKLAEDLTRAINCMGQTETQELARHMASIHRTLQQAFMREFVVPFLETMAENRTDLRNEASVEMAKKMIEVTKECYLPYV